MVIIEKEGKTLTVTNGVYDTMFRPLGYTVVGSTRPSTGSGEPGKGKHTTPAYEEPTEASEEPYEELSEKPISEMTFKELKSYAVSLGINIDGLSSRKEIKKAIAALLL